MSLVEETRTEAPIQEFSPGASLLAGKLGKMLIGALGEDAPIDRVRAAARDLAERVPLDEFQVADPFLFRNDAFWPFFERLRREAPVHYCADSPFGPYWSVSTFDPIMAVDTNHLTYSSDWTRGGITIVDQPVDFPLPMFIAMDEPLHSVQRKAVQPSVQGDHLRHYQQLILERTQAVLDDLPEGEPFDWVDRVSIELTTMMLATLFGFPFEERRKLTRWSDVATGRNNAKIVTSDEQWRAEMLECLGYFMGIWQERVKAGPGGHDLISRLVHNPETAKMTQQEYLGNLILLIVGGNDTTRNSMSGSVYALNKWPDQAAKLRNDPSLVRTFVSEIVRWQTPLAHMRRTALVDTDLHGQKIRAGDKVVMWYVSGNRDETKFADADRVIVDRPNAHNHLSFGFGVHRCLGKHVAELQLRILWEEILKRFRSIEVLQEPDRNPSAFVKGYTYMPVIVRRH